MKGSVVFEVVVLLCVGFTQKGQGFQGLGRVLVFLVTKPCRLTLSGKETSHLII